MHHYCDPCGEYLPTACFYASTAKARRRICKVHWDKRQRRLKQGTEVASMLASLRVRLRKSPTPGLSRAWSRADVITVLRKGGYAPPYFQRDGRLCIVARDPARALTPDNATLMRSNRCRGRHHLAAAAAARSKEACAGSRPRAWASGRRVRGPIAAAGRPRSPVKAGPRRRGAAAAGVLLSCG